MAQARGLKVKAITLFALGGVSQIEGDATDAKTEFWGAIAGPIASLIIGFGCIAMAAAFRGMSVSDVMSRDCAIVNRDISLQKFVDTYVLRTGQRCFAVEDRGRFEGLITPRDVGAIPTFVGKALRCARPCDHSESCTSSPLTRRCWMRWNS